MHKRVFQALKRAFMHVSGLHPAYFDKMNQKFYKRILLSKYGGGRPETCLNGRSGPETHVYASLRSSPPNFDKNNQLLYNFFFKIKI